MSIYHAHKKIAQLHLILVGVLNTPNKLESKQLSNYKALQNNHG